MRKLMIGAAVAATALGAATVALGHSSTKEIGDTGPTVAFAAGPPMAFGAGPDDTFARDLADELGVSTDEVKRALKAVAEKEMADHRRDLAESIASHLDGVTVDQVVSALEVADEKMRNAFESGDPPSPDLFATTLADELGVSEDDVSSALDVARAAEFNAHRDEALKRLDDAVEAGKLSQKEADEIRDRLQQAPPALDFHGKGELPPPPPGGPGVAFAVPAG